MSKDDKIKALKPHLSAIMDKLVIANDAQYGGNLNPNASPLAAIGQVAAAKARANGSKPLNAQAWLLLGEDMYSKRHTAKKETINAVCDTLSAYALYAINNTIGLTCTFELMSCPTIHHHFVVVDRVVDSTATDCSTWGGGCFSIDLWHAKRDPTVTSRGWFSSAHHGKHGVYRNPSEHLYSLRQYEKVSVYSYVK